MATITQFSCSELLRLMYKYIQIPYSHIGYVRFLAEEGFIRCDITCSCTDCLIHHIHHCCKGVSPEKVWGPCILHNCSPLLENFAVHSFGNTILFWCMRDSELKFDSALCAVLLK